MENQAGVMNDWVSFYNSPHSIYVNARHRDVHYARLADEIARYVPVLTAAVLDYGCGEALHADRLAAVVSSLTLAEAGPSVRSRLLERFAGHPAIAVKPAEDVDAMPEQSLDLVVMHSVSQYLTPDEFDHAAALFHRLLKPGGLLLVGDVVAPGVPAASDALALLRFGWRNGFFLAAVNGLFRTAFSGYWHLRRRIGLTRYSEEQMVTRLAALGFAARRAPVNLGHLQSRMTFLARKPKPK